MTDLTNKFTLFHDLSPNFLFGKVMTDDKEPSTSIMLFRRQSFVPKHYLLMFGLMSSLRHAWASLQLNDLS